ncbi:hypothetical protein [Phreatobacter stygius]|uniref:Uncharacterized protein n=1 Tax=Phreatobacter stygius TaxID=1940610 RepID=A0A4D7AVL6_9HYPH|nr:hypothetical protein [Phreatobacter stygius]QCI65019.1 hypothetical protein E8M01_12795 [Phreatobacter stygius]
MPAVGGKTDETAGGRFGRMFATIRRSFAAEDHYGLWTLTVDGAVAGALFREGDLMELTLFDGADPRLAGFDGPVNEPALLEQALAARLGETVGTASRVKLSPIPAWV